MTTRDFASCWNRFFFADASPLPLAIFRILFGLLLMEFALLLRSDLLDFFGSHALVSIMTSRNDHYFLARLWANGASDDLVTLGYAVFCISTVTLTLGFFTRCSASIIFVLLVMAHFRNGFVLSASDMWMRVSAFYLIFSPGGQMLSIDRWMAKRHGSADHLDTCWPWVQRLMQMQISLLYLTTFLHKIEGDMWLDGTAVYYAARLDDFVRFPVPFVFDHLWTTRLFTWASLGIEFSLGVLVWFQDLRGWVLAAGVALHLGIEWSMNIPLFEWMAIISFVVFVDASTLNRLLGCRLAVGKEASPDLPGGRHVQRVFRHPLA